MSQGKAHQENGNITIGALIAEDYRTAAVFEKYGIDFCCGGQATLAATCQEKDLDLTRILQEIETVKKEPVGRSENFAAWPLPFLIDSSGATEAEIESEATGFVYSLAGVIQ